MDPTTFVVDEIGRSRSRLCSQDWALFCRYDELPEVIRYLPVRLLPPHSWIRSPAVPARFYYKFTTLAIRAR
jgi:hypothetical protein